MSGSDAQQAIRKALHTYLEALYSSQYDKAYACLYQPDVQEFQETVWEFARQMEGFGENEDFFSSLGVPDLAGLQAMSAEDFMQRIFAMVGQEIGKEDLQQMLEGTRIQSIDETDYISIVQYEIPLKFMNEWSVMTSQVEMIYSGERWQILFKSGMRAGLARFQREVDLYESRKAKDRLDKIQADTLLMPITLMGYATEAGDIILEPRFKEAKPFSEGLAAVKVFNKFGYINQQGALVIKPQFLDAEDFSEGLAAIRIQDEVDLRKWGFIDQTGKMIIPAHYDAVSEFSQGRCAVMLDQYWGYIDAAGKAITPLRFEQAGDFWDGKASVEFYTEDGEWHELELDRDGNVLDEV